MKQLYDAASADPWRASHRVVTKSLPPSVTSETRFTQFMRALDRARRKSFVQAMKPLRRLLRNQGAVNDSLIEALFHLSAQVQEMTEEINDLRAQLGQLQKQIPPKHSATDRPPGPGAE
jgi:hypothetical protein